MPFTPMELMLTRVDKNGDTDYARFSELLYAGEFILKLTTAAFVAALRVAMGAPGDEITPVGRRI